MIKVIATLVIVVIVAVVIKLAYDAGVRYAKKQKRLKK